MSRTANLLTALVLALITSGLFIAGYMFSPEGGTISRMCQIFGGMIPSGIIQFITFLAFYLGMLEIRSRSSKVKKERRSLSAALLPESEQWVLSPDDVNELKLKMIEIEKTEKSLLTDLIKKACTKFRSNKSVSEVLEIVGTQVKINSGKAEGGQSIIRYLAWAIPSIGFIGTIVGIASSLGLANEAGNPEVLERITDNLAVAFDTTLVALLLSLIIMYSFHVLQENEDDLHTDMEEYVMENLVNRIHTS